LNEQAQDILLIADPDNLISSDEKMIAEIHRSGYKSILFEDSITVRYEYELKVRDQNLLNSKKYFKLAIIFPGTIYEAKMTIPFDIIDAVVNMGGTIFSVTINEIFPYLSYTVLEQIETLYFDKLYDSYIDYDGPTLGDKQTKEYILSNVLEISLSNMKSSPKELIRILLSIHYRSVIIPQLLIEYMVQELATSEKFINWPLRDIIESSDSFFKFLQKEWQAFLESLIQKKSKSKIPFENRDIRVYLDNLFLEGYLNPVQVEDYKFFPDWTHSGILINKERYWISNIHRRIINIELDLPDENATFADWQKFALNWSGLLVLRFKNSKIIPRDLNNRFEKLHDSVEERFAKWMSLKYFGLSNLPYLPKPIMVHHIPKFLQYKCNEDKRNSAKIALIVIDGMSLDQWLIIKEFITVSDFDIVNDTIFAWVPTLTSISRQSIFAGEPPFYFEETLCKTSLEKRYWEKHWENSGLEKGCVFYNKGYMMQDETEVDQIISDVENKKVIGIVINTLDKMMHGMILGTHGMHQQVEMWAQQGHFVDLIQKLLHHGFSVYVTADHGNISSVGQGRPNQGVLVEKAGSRARIYENQIFLNQAHIHYPTSIIWPNSGLESHYFLLAGGRLAFADEHKLMVSHGGISIEEVLVPFVGIKKRVGRNAQDNRL
jgi:hypothetical protein